MPSLAMKPELADDRFLRILESRDHSIQQLLASLQAKETALRTGQQEGLDYTLFRPFNWIGPGLDSIHTPKQGS